MRKILVLGLAFSIACGSGPAPAPRPPPPPPPPAPASTPTATTSAPVTPTVAPPPAAPAGCCLEYDEYTQVEKASDCEPPGQLLDAAECETMACCESYEEGEGSEDVPHQTNWERMKREDCRSVAIRFAAVHDEAECDKPHDAKAAPKTRPVQTRARPMSEGQPRPGH